MLTLHKITALLLAQDAGSKITQSGALHPPLIYLKVRGSGWVLGYKVWVLG